MAQIVFYEKPGCIGNARQKALLRRSGHKLEVRDLLTEAWTTGGLMAYLGSEPIPKWFNRSAPEIKSGDIDPAALTALDALRLLIDTPLLIRRPLMRIGDRHFVGFDQERLHREIGLALSTRPVTEGCPKGL